MTSCNPSSRDRPRGGWLPRFTSLGLPILLVAATLAVYANSLDGVFLLDDSDHIVNNSAIRQLWPITTVARSAASRPLLPISLAANYAWGGLDVTGYHVFNIVVHLVAGLALYGLVRRTLRLPSLGNRFETSADGLAFAVALIWLVHPLQTQAVTYIVQRCESMMGMFFLLTMYAYLRGSTVCTQEGASRGIPAGEFAHSPFLLATPTWRRCQSCFWYALCLVSCCLGLACKEVMVMVVPVLCVYDRTFISASWPELVRRRGYVFLSLIPPLLFAAWIIVPGVFAGTSAGFGAKPLSSWEYVRSQPAVILRYLQLALVPYPQCFDYGWRVETQWLSRIVFPSAVLLVLAAMSTWMLLRGKQVGFLGAAFFFVLAPTSSFMPIVDLCVEHRMYLPLAAVIAFIVVCGETLIHRATRSTPRLPANRRERRRQRRQGGKGVPLTSERSEAPGRACNVAAFVTVAAVATTFGVMTHVRNRAYASEVMMWSDVALRAPFNPRGHVNLARYLQARGEHARAAAHLRIAGQLSRQAEIDFFGGSSPAELHFVQGLERINAGDTAKAKQEFQEAIRLDPRHSAAHISLGKLLVSSDPGGALTHFRLAVELDPDSSEAHNNLGALLLRNRSELALPHLEKALALNPKNVDARVNLGNLCVREGRLSEGARHYQGALDVNPSHAIAMYNLSIIRRKLAANERDCRDGGHIE
jgi:Flp pilus assembly protein TadD